MWRELGPDKKATIVKAIGWNNLGNVDWRNPLEAAATLVYIFLCLTAIIWVPVCILTGPGGWVIGAGLWVLGAEVAPPDRPWKELDQQLPASQIARTPEALYQDELARIRADQAEEAARRRRGDHLW